MILTNPYLAPSPPGRSPRHVWYNKSINPKYPKYTSAEDKAIRRKAVRDRFYAKHKARIIAEAVEKRRNSPAAVERHRLHQERLQKARLEKQALKEERVAALKLKRAESKAASKERAQIRRRNYKKTPAFLVVRAARRRFRKIVKEKLHSTNFNKMTGCTPAFLCNHLEAQFKPQMTWANYGEWHIDHIVPCKSFDLSKQEQINACFHYSNLQPLWASENIAKGAVCNFISEAS